MNIDRLLVLFFEMLILFDVSGFFTMNVYMYIIRAACHFLFTFFVIFYRVLFSRFFMQRITCFHDYAQKEVDSQTCHFSS